MLRIVIFSIVAVSLIFIFSEIFKFLSAIDGTNRQMLEDKSSFLERLQEYEMVSWLWKELNVLSLDFQLNHTSRLFNSLYEGAFTSIYGEYIGAVVAKRYGDKHLILFKTSEDQYHVKIDNKGKSHISINEGKAYDIEINENEFLLNKGKSNFQLKREAESGFISLNGKEIIATNSLESTHKEMERLISMIPDTVTDEDQKIVKFLLLFYLIWQQLTD